MDQDNFHRLLGKTAATRLVQARQQSLTEKLDPTHSIEPIATVNGVEYVNDAPSTYLDATLKTQSSVTRSI